MAGEKVKSAAGEAQTASAASDTPVVARMKTLLMRPLVAFMVTVAIRLIVYAARSAMEARLSPLIAQPSLSTILAPSAGTHRHAATTRGGLAAYYSPSGEQIPSTLPIQFSLLIPPTDAGVWREAVFWRQHFLTPLPKYIEALVPWYVRFIPAALASSPVTGVWLSVCDGLTAYLVAGWSSATFGVLYSLFVLNPFTVLPAVYESLTPLECLMLALVVQCCVLRGRSKGVASWLWEAVGVGLSLCLGSDFIALTAAVVFPVGSTNRRRVFAVTMILILSMGAYALRYLYRTDAVFRATSLYAPPDNGVRWYVRQLVLPAFERCLDLFHLQLPAIMVIPMAAVMPSYSPLRRTPAIFTDMKLFVVLMAVCLCILLRNYLTLPYCCMALLFLYSSLNTAATKTVVKRGEATRSTKGEVVPAAPVTVTYSVYFRVRVLVPVYFTLLSVPLELGFYVGWVLLEVANANWVFFAQMAFVVGGAIFCVLWYSEVLENVLEQEKEQNGELEKTTEGGTASPVGAAAAKAMHTAPAVKAK